MISFPLLYIKGSFVETMRSLFSRVFTIGNSCGELHKQGTLPYLGAPRCDKCTQLGRKSPSTHTPVTKQKWPSQTKTLKPRKGRCKPTMSGHVSVLLHVSMLRGVSVLRSDQLLSTSHQKPKWFTVHSAWHMTDVQQTYPENVFPGLLRPV